MDRHTCQFQSLSISRFLLALKGTLRTKQISPTYSFLYVIFTNICLSCPLHFVCLICLEKPQNLERCEFRATAEFQFTDTFGRCKSVRFALKSEPRWFPPSSPSLLDSNSHQSKSTQPLVRDDGNRSPTAAARDSLAAKRQARYKHFNKQKSGRNKQRNAGEYLHKSCFRA